MNQPDGHGSKRRLAIEELFGTTHWSVVLAADMSGSPDDASALEYLCFTFEKRWATTLLERVLTRLGNEFARSGKPEFFEHLKDYVWVNQPATPVREIATRFGVSESAIRVTTHRLRHRFRDLLRLEIAHTVTTFEDIDEEIRYLAQVLREP